MTKRKTPRLDAGMIELSTRPGGPQHVRATGKRVRFDATARRKFLDALALTCNISIAAEHVGMCESNAYAVRRRDPVFAAQWREALDLGAERLEAKLIEHGGAGLPLPPADPTRALAEGLVPPPFNFEIALRTLQYFAKYRQGVARKSSHPTPSAADTDAAITELLRRVRVRAAIEPALSLPAPGEPDAPGEAEGA